MQLATRGHFAAEPRLPSLCQVDEVGEHRAAGQQQHKVVVRRRHARRLGRRARLEHRDRDHQHRHRDRRHGRQKVHGLQPVRRVRHEQRLHDRLERTPCRRSDANDKAQRVEQRLAAARNRDAGHDGQQRCVRGPVFPSACVQSARQAWQRGWVRQQRRTNDSCFYIGAVYKPSAHVKSPHDPTRTNTCSSFMDSVCLLQECTPTSAATTSTCAGASTSCGCAAAASQPVRGFYTRLENTYTDAEASTRGNSEHQSVIAIAARTGLTSEHGHIHKATQTAAIKTSFYIYTKAAVAKHSKHAEEGHLNCLLALTGSHLATGSSEHGWTVHTHTMARQRATWSQTSARQKIRRQAEGADVGASLSHLTLQSERKHRCEERRGCADCLCERHWEVAQAGVAGDLWHAASAASSLSSRRGVEHLIWVEQSVDPIRMPCTCPAVS
eukprot:363451-Chlamydomonas_euryale.AAC.11